MTDERFANVHSREHHWSELMALLDEWASHRSAQECEAIMNAGGVPCSRYFSIKEAMQAPPIVEREVLQSIDDGSGPFKVTNPAFRFKHTQAQARNAVPDLGADGPALLRQL